MFELIHSEDRDDFKRQLSWSSRLPADKAHLTLKDLLTNKQHAKYLERNFTVRFRCLLDNTSGFLTLDIVGRLNLLHGQYGAFQIDEATGEIINPSVKTYSKSKNAAKQAAAAAAAALAASSAGSGEARAGGGPATAPATGFDKEPMMALFAIACPFGPPSLFELPQRDSLFKTKHRVDMMPTSLDAKYVSKTTTVNTNI